MIFFSDGSLQHGSSIETAQHILIWVFYDIRLDSNLLALFYGFRWGHTRFYCSLIAVLLISNHAPISSRPFWTISAENSFWKEFRGRKMEIVKKNKMSEWNESDDTVLSIRIILFFHLRIFEIFLTNFHKGKSELA